MYKVQYHQSKAVGVYTEVKKNISFWFEFWLDDLWSALTNNKNLQPVSNKRSLSYTCEIDTNMIRNHQSVLSIRFSSTSISINSAMSQRNIGCSFAIRLSYRISLSYIYIYIYKPHQYQYMYKQNNIIYLFNNIIFTYYGKHFVDSY